MLNDSRSVFLTSGHISLTEKFACGEYIYPGSVYEGIELFIDHDDMEPPLLRDHFGIRIPTLRRLYCLEGETFIAKLPLPEELTDRLQGLSITEEPVRTISMKTGVIDLLALLQYRHPAPEAKRLTYYTKPQVEMAKQIEAIISGDLSQPHTAREFAARFSVSESSIKNYFRGVYGQSILQDTTHRRMLYAVELLSATSLPVIEIASRVGYENQSKFSAAFRKSCGVSPREFRQSQ